MVSADDTVKVEPTQGGDSDVALSADTAALPAEAAPADDAPMDPEEYARLLELYDSSFRNLAEGEVIKGTGPKVPPSEVTVGCSNDYLGKGSISLCCRRKKRGIHVRDGWTRRWLPTTCATTRCWLPSCLPTTRSESFNRLLKSPRRATDVACCCIAMQRRLLAKSLSTWIRVVLCG